MSTAMANGDRDSSTTATGLAGFIRTTVADLLGTTPQSVPAERPLRELGMDSALTMTLVTRLAHHLDRPVPSWVAWQYPTIAALAAHLTGDTGGPAPAPAAARERGATAEPIAVVGLGCKLPGGVETPEALWRALADGLDAVREVPADRWNIADWLDEDLNATGKMTTRWGGFLDDIGAFDAELFRISPTEARQMDPQQRMALEVAWAAVEDARMRPDGLSGTRTGVFVGTMAQEYHLATGADPRQIGTHSAVGWDNSIIAARIAYTLGLQGPALSVATACSSSLTATHLAMRSLRDGECDLALAGGVNVMLHPHTTVAMTKFGGMNPSGQCRAFDAGAGGYVRGEGCGVVVLRRLSDALAAGDRIYAVIRGSAVNNDGASNGLTAPSLQAQVDVVRTAWQDARIAPHEVSYVEAHGTGTLLGDPIEAEALGTVFAPGREEVLRIGSAKTNFGHLEPAAGVVGLMKTVLALHHGQLPASLHFEEPNPHIDFEGHKLRVVGTQQPWPAARRRYAGVSGFGFGGTNAHLALEEAPYRRRRLVPVAAESERELDAALTALAASTSPEVAPARVGGHRAVAGLTGSGTVDVVAGPSPAGERPALAFFFSGHGAQWLGMGRDLLSEPAFRTALTACDDALRPYTGWSVARELLAEDGRSRLERTDVVQPVLFAVQVALARTLAAWGQRPDVVFGQSVGEVAAAVVAGALTLDEGARLITTWSALIAERACGRGTVVVCDLTVEQAQDRIAGTSLSIGGHLAPDQVCLSGPLEAVAQIERALADDGIPVHRVGIDYASHSAGLRDLAPELIARLGDLPTRTTDVPFLSTVTGAHTDGTALDAAYWASNMHEPMLLTESVHELVRQHGEVRIVELGPHPIAQHSFRRTLATLAEHGPSGEALATCRRDQPSRQALEDLIGRLWCDGFEVNWASVTGTSAEPEQSGQSEQSEQSEQSDVPVVVPVSGHTAGALAANAGRWADWLEQTETTPILRDVAVTAAGRTAFEYRAGVVAGSVGEAVAGLRAVSEGRSAAGVVTGSAPGSTPGIAFLFTGQGAQRVGMGRELYEAFPAFAEAFDEVCGHVDFDLKTL
ncbi:beta-ketoacyl synthase N-terminal-like domain-containing protein, partial [Streptomyces sp. NPDC002851]